MSRLIFNPQTGLHVPETAEIRGAVAQDWLSAFAAADKPPLDTEPTTPAGQLIDAETAIIEDKNAQILYLANQFNPLVADGRWQDALGHIYFLERHIETPSVVTVTLTGLAGTVVPAGALVRTADGVVLAANGGATIQANGRAQAIFSAQSPGPVQIPAHSVTSIITTIPGWDTVDNEAAGIPGRHRENRFDFERRRAASVSVNAHGTVAALYAAIGEIQGVIDLVVLENIENHPVEKWGVMVPANGVFISVYGGSDGAIAEAIYRKKDAGASMGGNTQVVWHDGGIHNYRVGVTYIYNIERPIPLSFGVQVNIRKTPTTAATIIDDVKKAILADFNGETEQGRVRMAAICYASRFYRSIMAAGVHDIVNIKVAAPTGSAWLDEIHVRADQMPALSYDDILVNVVNP